MRRAPPNNHMSVTLRHDKQDQLIARLDRVWKDEHDPFLFADMIRSLDARYDLIGKAAREHGVTEIITQMIGRLANSFGRPSDLQEKVILDIACGSTTSRAPAFLHIDTPFGEVRLGRSARGFTAQFEPWFCRILFELKASPVGVDFGDLEREVFLHHRVDLGQKGALDFLPSRSFDAVQDSRLFGSPEFTAQFPNRADRLRVAQEIRRQEQRLLKSDGIVIHSDAAALLD
ncbi:MAG TPA: hypothetical protein VI729_07140 [Anaerolineales bacterium]|nr:hypothetical protein [Anaerolineales bacterium]